MKLRDKQIKQSKYDTGGKKYKLNDDDNNNDDRDDGGGGGGGIRVEQATDLRNIPRKSKTH